MKQITLEKKITETKRLLNLAEDAVTQQISYMYYEFYAYEANRLFDYMNRKIKAQNKKIDDLEKQNKNPRELDDDLIEAIALNYLGDDDELDFIGFARVILKKASER